MSTTDTSVPQVIVNKLTATQYATATKNPNEFYAVTDAPAVDVMTGATSGTAGATGTVPAPAAGDNTKYLKGDGTWGGALDAELDYSTSEVDTGHTWIDGKTIYKKTLYIAALPNATTANYSFPNVNRAVKLEGIAWRNSGDCYPLPYTSGIDVASNIDVLYQKASDSVQVRTGADRSSFEGYVTLYYTKSS